MALIFVLGILVLLSTLSVLIIDALKTQLVEKYRRENRAELLFAAESGLAAKLAELAEYRAVDGAVYAPAQGWSDLPAGVREYMAKQAIELDITVVDESGKLPINTQDTAVLAKIFTHLNIPRSNAETLADRLADWTDADDVPRPLGAERDAYLAETPPANARIGQLEELLLIQGFPEWFTDAKGRPNARFAQLNSLVSVYAENDKPNINGASADVISFLANVTGESAEPLLNIRRTAGVRSLLKNAGDIAAKGGGAGMATHVSYTASLLRIQVRARRGETGISLEAIARVRGGALQILARSEKPAE